MLVVIPADMHAGQIPNAFKHFIGKCDTLAIFRIFRNWQHHFHGEEIVGIESEETCCNR